MLRIVLIYNNLMIVCICKNINSRQLKECLAREMSLDEITEEIGLGTGCGSCIEYACSIIEENQSLTLTNRSAA